MRKTRRKGDATSGEKKEGSMDAWKVENRLQGRKEGRTEDSEKWQKRGKERKEQAKGVIIRMIRRIKTDKSNNKMIEKIKEVFHHIRPSFLALLHPPSPPISWHSFSLLLLPPPPSLPPS